MHTSISEKDIDTILNDKLQSKEELDQINKIKDEINYGGVPLAIVYNKETQEIRNIFSGFSEEIYSELKNNLK